MSYDARVLTWINDNLSAPWLDDVMQVVTRGGGTFAIYILVALVAVVLAAHRRVPEIFIVIAGVWSAKAVNYALKLLFDRARPELWDTITRETSPSMPSGHSAGAAALACAMILCAWRTRWRVPVTVLAVVYAVAIGFSRMYLGVHYPSDVLVGFAVGAGWMALVWHFARRRLPDRAVGQRGSVTNASTAPTRVTFDEIRVEGSTTLQFVGEEHGSGSSFYVSRNEPGQGPALHTHPYTETFVIHEGRVRFTVGDEVIDAHGGDVLVVPANTAHGFTNVGDERMHSVNIHASATMIQTDLPSRRRPDGAYELT